VIFEVTNTLNSEGKVFDLEIFQWDVNNIFGDYIIKASSVIDNGARTAISHITYTQNIPESSITEISPGGTFVGDTIVFSGKLQTVAGTFDTRYWDGIRYVTTQKYVNAQGIPGAEIDILTKIDSKISRIVTGVTDSNGNYNIEWDVTSSGLPENFAIFAIYTGNQLYDASASPIHNIIVKEPVLTIFTDKDLYTLVPNYGLPSGYTIYGEGPPGDYISVVLTYPFKPEHSMDIANNVSVDSNGFYSQFLGNLPTPVLNSHFTGTITLTATSRETGLTASTTFIVEGPPKPKITNLETFVGYTDQGNQISLEGIQVELLIDGRAWHELTDRDGIARFNSIPADESFDYKMYIQLSDNYSFDLTDYREAKKTSNGYPTQRSPTITSYLYNLDISNKQDTFFVKFDLSDDLPYGKSDNVYVAHTFDLMTKISKFYHKVLNENPPRIDVNLWGHVSGYWSNNWTPDGQYAWAPIIEIKPNRDNMSTVGMEYTHYVQDYSYRMMGGYDSTPKKGNHFGFNNPSTGDSWVEGLGSFMPAVIADYYGMDDAGKFSWYHLETNKFAPNSEFTKWSVAGDIFWLDEEYSIATLLWDMYDLRDDGESTSSNIKIIWNLVKGYTNFEKHHPEDYQYNDKRHIKYFKDLFDYISSSSGLSNAEIKNLFDMHGIPNGYTPERPGGART